MRMGDQLVAMCNAFCSLVGQTFHCAQSCANKKNRNHVVYALALGRGWLTRLRAGLQICLVG